MKAALIDSVNVTGKGIATILVVVFNELNAFDTDIYCTFSIETFSRVVLKTGVRLIPNNINILNHKEVVEWVAKTEMLTILDIVEIKNQQNTDELVTEIEALRSKHSTI